MPWSKLKNVILAILAAANLCLLALVAVPAIQSGRLMDRAREEAIQFLQSRGVQVEADMIPQAMELTPQSAERDLEGEERAAAALLGSPVTAEARGGEVYRYFNENGSIQFHRDGTCSARLEPAAFPLGENRKTGCLTVLERMGLKGDILSEEGDVLVFRQTWEGSPLFTQQMTLTCQGNALAGITAGRQLVAVPQADPTRQTVTVATALIELLNGVSALGDVCNRIDAIETGYVTSVSLSGPTMLTPVWRVTTDTGAYQLDTVTGGVTRVS